MDTYYRKEEKASRTTSPCQQQVAHPRQLPVGSESPEHPQQCVPTYWCSFLSVVTLACTLSCPTGASSRVCGAVLQGLMASVEGKFTRFSLISQLGFTVDGFALSSLFLGMRSRGWDPRVLAWSRHHWAGRFSVGAGQQMNRLCDAPQNSHCHSPFLVYSSIEREWRGAR